MIKSDPVISGLGLITCLGNDVDENWRQLKNGAAKISLIDRFETEGQKTKFAGVVKGFDHDSDHPLLERMAMQVAMEALADSNLSEEKPIDRLFLAVPAGEISWQQRIDLAKCFNSKQLNSKDLNDIYKFSQQQPCDLVKTQQNLRIGKKICETFGIKRSPVLVTTACASGASAIELAHEAIRRGEISRAMVVGSDSTVNPEGIMRFTLLSALSTRNDDPSRASRPFSKSRDGFVIGEGAAAIILEDGDVAATRGANIYASIKGCANATDNFHRTRSNPSGDVILQCMKHALADANLKPSDIQVINAHGTSTPENDKMESLGISRLFKNNSDSYFTTSNKSMIGHTLSAAGAIEAAISALMIKHQTIVPTINVMDECEFDDVNLASRLLENISINNILSNSFGFGGQNVSLVLGKVHE